MIIESVARRRTHKNIFICDDWSKWILVANAACRRLYWLLNMAYCTYSSLLSWLRGSVAPIGFLSSVLILFHGVHFVHEMFLRFPQILTTTTTSRRRIGRRRRKRRRRGRRRAILAHNEHQPNYLICGQDANLLKERVWYGFEMRNMEQKFSAKRFIWAGHDARCTMHTMVASELLLSCSFF